MTQTPHPLPAAGGSYVRDPEDGSLKPEAPAPAAAKATAKPAKSPEKEA